MTYRYPTPPPRFYQELAHIPQPQQTYRTYEYHQRYPQTFQTRPQIPYQTNQYSNTPPRPIAPKPLPRPEPMHMDRSIRSNIVNYVNRPNFRYAGKRPEGQALTNPPYKVQSNFHIDTLPQSLANYPQTY